MQVDSLTLHGFRSHDNTNIILNNVNLLLGLNGAGKSSVKMGLEYLLTGRVTGVTDEAGRGLDDLIGDDHASFEVSAEIEELGRVLRTPATGLVAPGLTGPSSAQEPVFYDRIGASREVITACLNTSRFLDLPANDQKSMLFRLMDLTFDGPKLREHVPEACRAVFDRLYPAGLAGGAEVFDSFLKVLTEDRKLAKKKLGDLKLAIKNAPQQEPLPPGVWEAREQIPAQLAQLKAEREKLIEQLGREKAQAEAAEKAEADRLEKELAEKAAVAQKLQAAEDARARKAEEAAANAPEIERLNQLINALQAKEAELRPETTDKAAIAEYETQAKAVIQQAEAALEVKRTVHTNALVAISKAQAEHDAATKLAKAIRGTNTCPLGGGLKCSADRVAMVAVVEQEAQEAARAREAAKLTVDQAVKDVTNANNQLTAARQALLANQIRRNDWGKCCLDLDQARANLKALQPGTEGDDSVV